MNSDNFAKLAEEKFDEVRLRQIVYIPPILAFFVPIIKYFIKEVELQSIIFRTVMYYRKVVSDRYQFSVL